MITNDFFVETSVIRCREIKRMATFSKLYLQLDHKATNDTDSDEVDTYWPTDLCPLHRAAVLMTIAAFNSILRFQLSFL